MNISLLKWNGDSGKLELEEFDQYGYPVFVGVRKTWHGPFRFIIRFSFECRRWIITLTGCRQNYLSHGASIPKKFKCFVPPNEWYFGAEGSYHLMVGDQIKSIIWGYRNKFKDRIVLYSREKTTPENKKMIEQICRILGLISALLKSPLPMEMTEEICKSLYIILN